MATSRNRKSRTAIKYSFAIFSIILGLACVGQAQDISGDWQGTLVSPMGELRMVLHITRSADGTYKATMDSPDQAAAGANLDVITLDASKVHFTLNIVKGVFEGALKGNGSISGNWTQGTGGQKMPIVFAKTTTPIKMQHDPAPPSDIDGTWEGTFETPAGADGRVGKNHVTFHIKNTADGLTAIADLPDMNGIKGWPATSVSRKGNSINIRMKQVNGIFQGKINKTLDTITGDWIQGDDPARALNMKRTKGEAGPETPKPATAEAPKK
jgi:hypothetical protein